MKVFSTYDDKVPELDKSAYTFVRVSCAEPRYPNEMLGALDKAVTLGLLNKTCSGHGNRHLLLPCDEAPPENCHRHLIGDFLGINIEEISLR